MRKDIVIEGEGGKNGSARQPEEAENTLQTSTLVNILEVISEGEIVGIVGGYQGTFLNQMPIENLDGTKNFDNVTGDYRTGTPSQTTIPGFEEVSAIFPLNTLVEKDNDVVQDIIGTDIDSAIVTLYFQQGLSKVDTDSGNLDGHSVDFDILVQQVTPSLGSYISIYGGSNGTIEGKSVTQYQTDIRFSQPANSTSWRFKVVRISDDDKDVTEKSVFHIARWVEVQSPSPPLTYDNTAIVGITIPAEEVGNQIPTRGYLVKGIKCEVPVNYDPDTRTYSGGWNGDFKTAWTDNPAWVLYDIITNLRYGIGTFVGQEVKVDKWEFYDCGVYSDGLIPNGTGHGPDEHRFSFNGVIQKRSTAWQLLQTMASVMQAVVISNSDNEISLVQDRPRDTSKIINNSNVIGGLFTYSSSDIAERPTAINVTFNDKEDRYLPRTVSEPQANDTKANARIDKYGFILQDVAAYATVTEGQARRFARLLLYSATYEYDDVIFILALNAVDLEVGNVVGLMDNDYLTADNTTFLSGRILSITGVTVTLDVPVDLSETGYKFSTMSQDHDSLVEQTITNSGTTDTLTLAAPLPAGDYTLNEFYCYKTGIIEPRLYKITGINETSRGQFTITGNFYDPQKWDVVELGLAFKPYNYNIQLPLPAMTGLAVIEDFRNDDNLATSLIRLTWDYNSKHLSYEIKIRHNAGATKKYDTSELFIEFENIPIGNYKITARAVGLSRTMSPPVTIYYAYGLGTSPLLPPVGLEVVGGGSVFNSDRVAVTWAYNPANDDNLGTLKDYRVGIYESNGIVFIKEYSISYEIVKTDPNYKGATVTYLREHILNDFGTAARSFEIRVRSRDLLGRTSTATTLVINNPAPALPGPASTVTGFGRDIIVTLDPTDTLPDIAELIVSGSLTSGFDPADGGYWWYKLPASGAFEGSAIRASGEGTFYIRFAISDTYNEADLNWTIEFTVIITDGEVLVIFPTPTTPLNLDYSQVTTIGKGGEVVITTTLFWDQVAEDTTSYTIAWKNLTLGDTEYNYLDVYENRLVLPVWGDDHSLEGKVKANYGNKSSAWSNSIFFTTETDAAAPSIPTGLSATTGYDIVRLSWDLPPEKDYLHTELWASADNVGANAVFSGVATGNSFTTPDFGPGVIGYLWARSVDTTGNKSEYYPLLTEDGILATTSGVDLGSFIISNSSVTFNPLGGIVGLDGRPAGVLASYSSADIQNITYLAEGSSVIKLVYTSGDTVGASWSAFKVAQGTSYTISFRVKAKIAKTNGLNLRIDEINYELPLGYTHISENAGLSEPGVLEATSVTVGLLDDSAVTEDWVDYSFTYDPPDTIRWASPLVYFTGGAGLEEFIVSGDDEYIVSNDDEYILSDNIISAELHVDVLMATSDATVGAPEGTYVGSVLAEDLINDFDQLVIDFNTSNNADYSPITAPVILDNGTAIDHIINEDSSASVTFEWEWSGNEYSIDGFAIIFRGSTTDSAPYTILASPSSEAIVQVPASKRAFVWLGIPASGYYTVGILAYRKVTKDDVLAPDGLIVSPLVQPTRSTEDPYRPSNVVAFTGLIDTIAASNVNKWSALVNDNSRMPRDFADQTSINQSAGLVTGASIYLTGSAVFNGNTSTPNGIAACFINGSRGQGNGAIIYGGSGYGLLISGGTGGTGLQVNAEGNGFGIIASSAYGKAIYAASNGIALEVTSPTTAFNCKGNMTMQYGTNKVTNLDADKVDGYHAGNSSGQVAVANGTTCTNLSADLIDGYDSTSIVGYMICDVGAAVASNAAITIKMGQGLWPTYHTVGTGSLISMEEDPSDIRVKEEIQDELLGLNFINSLNPITFKYIDGRVSPQTGERVLMHGVIAQDVQAIIGDPDIDCMLERRKDDGMLLVNYTQLTTPTIKAVQELSAKVDLQETLIADLTARLTLLETR